MCKQGENQNEQAESEADSERDGNKRMHGSFLQRYRLNGLERHFLRKLLADLVNHLSSAFHLQAVVQFQIYELPLLARFRMSIYEIFFSKAVIGAVRSG